MSDSDKIVLRSSDGEQFEVEKAVARRSPIIDDVITYTNPTNEIPLLMVKSNILAKLIEYWEKQRQFERFQDEFVRVEEDTLFEIIRAADYLNIEGLLDLTGQHVANMKGDIPYDICNIFNIESDSTQEEKYWFRGETSGHLSAG